MLVVLPYLVRTVLWPGMAEFVPLRKKLRRAGTGAEDNFVPSYLPGPLREAAADTSSEAAERVRIDSTWAR